MRRLALLIALLTASCDKASTSETTTNGGTTGSDDGSTTGAMDTGGSSESSTTDVTTMMATSMSMESTSSESGNADSSDGEPAVCGDGVKGGDEKCDGEDFGGATCQSNGFMDGVLTCSDDCLGYSTELCFVCGDGEVQGGEDCDGSVPNGVDCESLDFTEGEVSCDDSCHFDVSLCTLCGDGVAEGNEACDATDLGGNDCTTVGFDSGTLGCHVDTCGFDYSGCSGGQYLQDFEACTLPPEFTFTGNADWTADNTSPITGCSAHNLDINDSQTSGMVLVASFVIDGTVSFNHKEDTESCCDHLQFYVDGAMQQQWSGAGTSVQAAMFDIPAGDHTLEWRYTKDISISTGQDSVWVDDIDLFGGVPQ